VARLVNVRTNEHYLLDATEAVIGRHPSCHIRVLEKQVSRVHCRIVASEHGWVLHDAGSMLGTYLNGEILLKPQVLQPGDQIKVGTETFAFELKGDAANGGTLRKLSDASPSELIPFDVPAWARPRRRHVFIALAAAGAAAIVIATVLFLTRATPPRVVRRAASLLRDRQGARLWAMLSAQRKHAITIGDFEDRINALPDKVLHALRSLEVGTPRQADPGVAVPVSIHAPSGLLIGEVTLLRENGAWTIHSAPIEWLDAIGP